MFLFLLSLAYFQEDQTVMKSSNALGKEDLKDHWFQSACHWQGHLALNQVAQCPTQPGLGHFRIGHPQLLRHCQRAESVSVNFVCEGLTKGSSYSS